MISNENKQPNERRDESGSERLADDREVISRLLGELLAQEWMTRNTRQKREAEVEMVLTHTS